MTINEVQLGSVVRQVRSGLGVTQRELAEKAGLTVNYISRFENGHRSISIPTLNAVAEVLGVPALLLTTLATETPRSSDTDKDRLLTQLQTLTQKALSVYIAST